MSKPRLRPRPRPRCCKTQLRLSPIAFANCEEPAKARDVPRSPVHSPRQSPDPRADLSPSPGHDNDENDAVKIKKFAFYDRWGTNSWAAERLRLIAPHQTVSVSVAVALAVSVTLLHLYLCECVCVCEQSIISVPMENKNHKNVNGAENWQSDRGLCCFSICANKLLGALSTCANYWNWH